MDQDGGAIHEHTRKELDQYPAILTGQGWSTLFSRGTQQVISSGQDSTILPAQVASHSLGFSSSCPVMELAM